ncbi:condensation domain-containing protein, partial [Micromonospora sp. NPDC051296]|uniref:condensation domain-containing protein n=1 Tax=Micromonospora sp. NPDC051296 TaxID=3155046 RepID=UPI00341EBE02
MQWVGLAEIQQVVGLGALFDTAMVFDNYPLDTESLFAMVDSFRVVGADAIDVTHYPLALVVLPGGELRFRLDYRPDVFDDATAAGIADRFQRILTAIGDDPDQYVGNVDALRDGEARRVLAALPPIDGAAPVVTVPELFWAQVERTPHAPALFGAEGVLDYAALGARVDVLTRVLVTHGAGAERAVAIALPAGPEYAVAVLSVLAAGAAVMPHQSDLAVLRVVPAGSDTVALAEAGEPGPAVLVEVVALAGPGDPEQVATKPRPQQAACVWPGEPAVVIDHRALAHAVSGQPTPAGVAIFDGASSAGALIGTLLAPLTSGGAVAFHVPEDRLAHRRVSPGQLAAMADADLPTGRLVVAGEPVVGAALDRWLGDLPWAAVEVAYGSPETTGDCAIWPTDVTGSAETAVLGVPVGTARHHLLDHALRPVPDGVAGQLYIGGDALARGYRDQPGSTATRFVADPFGAPGLRLYRTGDLARRRSDGRLELIRGSLEAPVAPDHRRVVAALLARPDVADAVVTGTDPAVAHVAHAGTAPDPAAVRRDLLAALPEAIVPRAVLVHDALPLTPSGYYDWAGLAAAAEAATIVKSEIATRHHPRTEILRGVFAEVLGGKPVGVDDSFFELGGHSLSAVRLAGRIRQVLGVQVPIRRLFDAPTPAALAAVLEPGADRQAPLAPVPRPPAVAASSAQRRLWVLHQMAETGPAYNVPAALRLAGDLDAPALRAALADVVARHESLRTVFRQGEDGPEQVVLDRAQPELFELAVDEAALPERLRAAARYGFDLATEIPIRAWLFGVGPAEHVLLLLVHHIAGDGWSMPILIRDLASAYRARHDGRQPAWAPLPVQYADFTLWQQRALGSEDDPDSVVSRQLAYWTEALAGLPEELSLPTDRPRPAVASYRGDTVDVYIPDDLHEGLVELAGRAHVTVFMVVQAALAALLTRLG